MSRPRHYWYGISRKMICQYPKMDNENSQQEKMWRKAIEDALDETSKMTNGELRIKAINDVLFQQTKTVYGVCQDVFYEERTVRGWLHTFINMVGQKAGY